MHGRALVVKRRETVHISSRIHLSSRCWWSSALSNQRLPPPPSLPNTQRRVKKVILVEGVERRGSGLPKWKTLTQCKGFAAAQRESSGGVTSRRGDWVGVCACVCIVDHSPLVPLAHRSTSVATRARLFHSMPPPIFAKNKAPQRERHSPPSQPQRDQIAHALYRRIYRRSFAVFSVVALRFT